MYSFVYDIQTRVYFGDKLDSLGEELGKYGKNVLLCYGGGSIKKIGLYDRVVGEIKKAGLNLYELSGIAPNPRIQSVRDGKKICLEKHIDVVLAVGGGSTLDCSKFVAASPFYDGDPWDFFAKNAPIEKALPLVTVLTLSATGSEMDTGGVLSNPDTNDKLGRLALPLRPKASFLDPVNTYTVSPYQTACGSADILSHLFEVYFTTEPDLYMIDGFNEVLIKTVLKFAPIAVKDPENYEARANLMWASSWAINDFIGYTKKQDWTCHPIEHELSAFYDITHGHGLAILTPRWLEYCLNEKTLPRYETFGRNVFGLTGTSEQIAKKSIQKVSDFLFKDLGLKSKLSDLNITDEKFKVMANKACRGKTINGFVTLTPKDVEVILVKSK